MKEFRQTLEQLLPKLNYQEQWQGETCFEMHFISKMIKIMISQDMDITDEDLDDYVRMPIDMMIEKRPELLSNVLTAIHKLKCVYEKSRNPEYRKAKVKQWMLENT